MVFGLENKTPRKDSVDAAKRKNTRKEARANSVIDEILYETAQDALSENGIDNDEVILSSSLMSGSLNNLTYGSMNNSGTTINTTIPAKNSNGNILSVNGNATSGIDGDDEKEVETRWPVFEIFDGPYPSGRLLLCELMKIGIIYGFISSLKGIHDWLLRNPSLFGAVYRGWCHSLVMASLMIWHVAMCCNTMVTFVFYALAPKRIISKASGIHSRLLTSFYETDHYLSEKLSNLIEHHTWIKETGMELIQNAFHYFLGRFENRIGIPIRQRFVETTMVKMLLQFKSSWSQPRSETSQKGLPTAH